MLEKALGSSWATAPTPHESLPNDSSLQDHLALGLLVYGFLTSRQTLFATAALILVAIYVFSCIAIEIIAKDSELTANEITEQIVSQIFWGVGHSMLTIFQFVTLDGLREIYYPLCNHRKAVVVRVLLCDCVGHIHWTPEHRDNLHGSNDYHQRCSKC